MKPISNWEQETKLPLITSCKQAARLISLSFERNLTFRESIAMHIHLSMCKTCTFYKRQIAALRKIFVCHEEVLAHTTPSEDECLDLQTKQKMKELIDFKK